MLSSLRSLFQSPYSRKHVVSSLYRFLLWKVIRAFKVKQYKFGIWNGMRVHLYHDSPQSMWLMYDYWVDWEEFNLIKDLVQEDDVVFDVGANIGLYSLWMSSYVKNGKVHAFEPDAKSFARLGQQVSLNGKDHVIKVNNLAVSNKPGTLYFTKDLDVKNHLVNERESNAVQVKAVTLDDYCRHHNIRHIRYFKIDIEGFELFAFQGAASLLKDGSIDVIQLEINDALLNSGATTQELINFLNQYGYELAAYNVQKRKLEKMKFHLTRENYFAVREIDRLNAQLNGQQKAKA